MEEKFLSWLAGFWEGEGCFTVGPPSVFMIVQVRKQPLLNIRRRMGGHLYPRKSKHEGWSDAWVWQVANRRDIIQVVEKIIPFLTFRKKEVQRKLKKVKALDTNSIKHDWARHEIQFLRKNWKQFTDIELAKKLSRTAMSVLQKRRDLGSMRKECNHTDYAIWTQAETDFLKANYNDKTDEEIANDLGRGRYSIKERRLRLGLTKGSLWRPKNG
jgi:hypothetical protein